MTYKQIKDYLISGDEFLDIIENLGLSTHVDTTGSYKPNVIDGIQATGSLTKPYKTQIENQKEPIFFLPPDFFMKTVKMTEDSLQMTLFQ